MRTEVIKSKLCVASNIKAFYDTLKTYLEDINDSDDEYIDIKYSFIKDDDVDVIFSALIIYKSKGRA